MWDKLFEKFKKQSTKAEKVSEDLDAEFEKIKFRYANLGNADIYLILTEYFLAKIEINRDVIDGLNVFCEADKIKEIDLKAENRAMRGLIEDVESMKVQMETDKLMTAQAEKVTVKDAEVL